MARIAVGAKHCVYLYVVNNSPKGTGIWSFIGFLQNDTAVSIERTINDKAVPTTQPTSDAAQKTSPS
jgi:hypothetical protein